MKLNKHDASEYKPRQTVHAFLITGIVENPNPPGRGNVYSILYFENDLSITVDADWMRIQKPEAGGFYVINSEDQTCYMSAERFEKEYELQET